MILRYVSHFSQMLGCLIVESSNQNNGFFTRWQQPPEADGYYPVTNHGGTAPPAVWDILWDVLG